VRFTKTGQLAEKLDEPGANLSARSHGSHVLAFPAAGSQGWRLRWSAFRTCRNRIDPVPLALEGIGRQRDAAPRLVRPERRPVGAQAGEPEPRHGLEQEGEVVRALEGVAQGRQRHRIGPADPSGHRELLQRPGGERLARPDFDQHPPGLAPQLGHRVREPHRAAQVLRPVGGVRRLFGGWNETDSGWQRTHLHVGGFWSDLDRE